MNIEIIKSLKERAKEMLKDNYDRKIGDEEIYTIICELENFYTAYEKEKEKNKELEEENKNYKIINETLNNICNSLEKSQKFLNNEFEEINEKVKELRLDRRRR